MFEINDSGLFEAIHAAEDLEIYVAIGFNSEGVLIHYFIGNECVMHMYVLLVLHRGSKAEIIMSSMRHQAPL